MNRIGGKPSGDDGSPDYRGAGYASWVLKAVYLVFSPLYDLLTWWAFLPVGGEKRCRREIARWLSLEGGEKVLSLCCGTGTLSRLLVAEVPDLEIIGLDLSPAQIARARRLSTAGNIQYRVGDASDTGLPAASFDRVVIAFALHEMPRGLRRQVLGEAARVVRPSGLVVGADYRRPEDRASRLLQAAWWFFWLPGNPERKTARDLLRRGVAREAKEAGLEVVEVRSGCGGWVEGAVARIP